MKRVKFEISTLVCPECSNTFPIPRRRDRRREKNHIKNLYCVYCKTTQRMVEHRPFDVVYTAS